MAAPNSFPRSFDRGPIEAAQDATCLYLEPHFRDHLIAAPLKHRTSRPRRAVSPNFRDHLIAAPLKPRFPVRRRPELQHFRDHLIAAPLKQKLEKRRLLRAAISAII